MNITNIIDKIKTVVSGKSMRGYIADGFSAVQEDSTAKDTTMRNMQNAIATVGNRTKLMECGKITFTTPANYPQTFYTANISYATKFTNPIVNLAVQAPVSGTTVTEINSKIGVYITGINTDTKTVVFAITFSGETVPSNTEYTVHYQIVEAG